ncbi:MAG: DUF6048 family protein, partial [Flavobacteriaceae bacterium]
ARSPMVVVIACCMDMFKSLIWYAYVRLRPDLNAQWMEFLAGIKVQLFNNLYMGFSLRLNVLANQTAPENFANLYIPGFNKVTDENRFGIGFNYTLSYALPFRFEKKTTRP